MVIVYNQDINTSHLGGTMQTIWGRKRGIKFANLHPHSHRMH